MILLSYVNGGRCLVGKGRDIARTEAHDPEIDIVPWRCGPLLRSLGPIMVPRSQNDDAYRVKTGAVVVTEFRGRMCIQPRTDDYNPEVFSRAFRACLNPKIRRDFRDGETSWPDRRQSLSVLRRGIWPGPRIPRA